MDGSVLTYDLHSAKFIHEERCCKSARDHCQLTNKIFLEYFFVVNVIIKVQRTAWS